MHIFLCQRVRLSIQKEMSGKGSLTFLLPKGREEKKIEKQMTYGSRTIKTGENLKVLSLDSNRLAHKAIPKGALHSLHILKMTSELYLAANKIPVIPNDVFSELSELEKLNLSHSQITKKDIENAAFSNMIKLENLTLAENLLAILRLNKNRISLVRQEAFLTLENLAQIDLSNKIPRQLLITLQSLLLFHNHIRCMPRHSFCDTHNVESHLLVRLENSQINLDNVDGYALRCLRGYQVGHFY
uniref:Uncharacterized protein n=1 Tax=Dromaius novaehollandiae TaxID=8790 RepID=A0A8C4PBL6_DRONO